MREIVDRDEPITREVWDRDEAIEYFKDIGEKYKAELIQDLPADEAISVYRQGDWLDLCRGPHLPSTGKLGKAFKLMKLAGAYWRGDASNASCSASTAPPGATRRSSRPICTCSRRPRSATTAGSASEMDLFHLQEEAAGSGVLAPEGLDALSHARSLHAPPARGRPAMSR